MLKFSKVSCRWYLRCSRLSTSKTALTFPGNSLIGFTKKERPCSESSLAMKHGPSTMSLRRNSRAWSGSTHLLQWKKSSSQLALQEKLWWLFFGTWKATYVTVDFLEKGTTMNSERYCEVLNVVRHDVYSKRSGLTSIGVLFHQDNARPHTAKKSVTNWKFWMGGGSPSTLQSGFGTIWLPLVWTTENHLHGTKFSDYKAVNEICRKCLKSRPRDFYAKGILKLVRDGKIVYQYTGSVLKNKSWMSVLSYASLVTGKLPLLIELPSYIALAS